MKSSLVKTIACVAWLAMVTWSTNSPAQTASTYAANGFTSEAGTGQPPGIQRYAHRLVRDPLTGRLQLVTSSVNLETGELRTSRIGTHSRTGKLEVVGRSYNRRTGEARSFQQVLDTRQGTLDKRLKSYNRRTGATHQAHSTYLRSGRVNSRGRTFDARTHGTKTGSGGHAGHGRRIGVHEFGGAPDPKS